MVHSFYCTGLWGAGRTNVIANLASIAPGVSFVELADAYQSVARSLKYDLLFLCLVFSVFFVFDTTTGKRVRPAPYFLVGVAQLIFYLLLISIAERIGFDGAFKIASVATVRLITTYASWMFESHMHARHRWYSDAQSA